MQVTTLVARNVKTADGRIRIKRPGPGLATCSARNYCEPNAADQLGKCAARCRLRCRQRRSGVGRFARSFFVESPGWLEPEHSQDPSGFSGPYPRIRLTLSVERRELRFPLWR